MSKALLIIDMLNDFVHKKGTLFCGNDAVLIVPYINKLIDIYRSKGSIIIFACDNHKKDDEEFKRFLPHCVKGTWGGRVEKGIDKREGDYFVPKTRYSAFYKTNLEDILKKNNVDEVGVVGVCTSICIMDTVAELSYRDYKIKVYMQGVADLDIADAQFSFKRMKKLYGAEIVR